MVQPTSINMSIYFQFCSLQQRNVAQLIITEFQAEDKSYIFGLLIQGLVLWPVAHTDVLGLEESSVIPLINE